MDSFKVHGQYGQQSSLPASLIPHLLSGPPHLCLGPPGLSSCTQSAQSLSGEHPDVGKPKCCRRAQRERRTLKSVETDKSEKVGGSRKLKTKIACNFCQGDSVIGKRHAIAYLDLRSEIEMRWREEFLLQLCWTKICLWIWFNTATERSRKASKRFASKDKHSWYTICFDFSTIYLCLAMGFISRMLRGRQRQVCFDSDSMLSNTVW
jgi:hypothetical protein